MQIFVFKWATIAVTVQFLNYSSFITFAVYDFKIRFNNILSLLLGIPSGSSSFTFCDHDVIHISVQGLNLNSLIYFSSMVPL